jgi:hypothetical protein
MALRNEEILRIKYELSYNVTGIGAEPYITYSAIFDKAVQPYLIDISTTSSTAVIAATSGASVALTVASNPASISATQAVSFVAGSAVIVDVGPNQETSIIQSVSGLNFTMLLFLAHSGTYPVLLNGAEQTIRDILTRLDAIKSEMLNVAPKTAGMEQVDEVRMFSRRKGSVNVQDKFASLLFQRDTARRDLAGALGVPYLQDVRKNSGTRIEAY